MEVALAVRRSTDRKERHDSAIVRQAVECAGTDDGDAVHERRIDSCVDGKLQVSIAKRIESDGQSARGRTGQGSKDIRGNSKRNKRPA